MKVIKKIKENKLSNKISGATKKICGAVKGLGRLIKNRSKDLKSLTVDLFFWFVDFIKKYFVYTVSYLTLFVLLYFSIVGDDSNNILLSRVGLMLLITLFFGYYLYRFSKLGIKTDNYKPELRAIFKRSKIKLYALVVLNVAFMIGLTINGWFIMALLWIFIATSQVAKAKYV